MAFEPLILQFNSLIQNHMDSNHGGTSAAPFTVSGFTSPAALAFLISNHFISQRQQHIFIFSSEKEEQVFTDTLSTLAPHMPFLSLPAYDVSPYSGLYANSRIFSERLRWISSGYAPTSPRILTATIESIAQNTLPTAVFQSTLKNFRVGDDVSTDFFDILSSLGYQSVPSVEDLGTFASRGGVIDVFSPFHAYPVRIELFDTQIESLRYFDPHTQRSLETIQQFTICAAKEVLFYSDSGARATSLFQKSANSRNVSIEECSEILHALRSCTHQPGIEFLLPYFYAELSSPLEHIKNPQVWLFDPNDCQKTIDMFLSRLKHERDEVLSAAICPNIEDLYSDARKILSAQQRIVLERVHIHEDEESNSVVQYQIKRPATYQLHRAGKSNLDEAELEKLCKTLQANKEDGFHIFVFAGTKSQSMRIDHLLKRHALASEVVDDSNSMDLHWSSWCTQQEENSKLVHILPLHLPESFVLVREKLYFCREEDFFGFKKREPKTSTEQFHQHARALSFGDIKPGDKIVHIQHGVGTYDGLTKMQVQGIDAEFLQISYKGNDRLYLPVYRIGQLQKYSGVGSLDKLGGKSWETTKVKVRSHIKDVASELLALYAKRVSLKRAPFSKIDDDYRAFEGYFPFDETDDQLKAINDIFSDYQRERPMDRLVCGDVGFGKTEIAMRAAFKCVQDRRQVAVLVPTTVLTLQHFESFVRRFHQWPIRIASLSRTTDTKERKDILQKLKTGEVDIVVGTHRLLSNDVEFKNLGLLVIDEEHRFGVTHKEKIKKIKNSVDTLTLSATPIPRTLNMALLGIRDLSLLNTPPQDRLPIRTFVYKFNKEIIRKAVLSEVARGGQVYFLHNRVDTIYSLCDELRELLPDVRIRVGHGQMKDDELEDTMLSFFKHEFDVLLCTTIIESGMDVTRANTIFINNAHALGLSQLYQIRGRVGRGKERAYCYLMIPPNLKLEKDQQERLKVIQENTALGSGLVISQHDLELRGAGNILGEEQSGDISAVGYELYMELLEDALREAKGEAAKNELPEPEINLRIPAFIPDNYISDIRVRLFYYKALAEITSATDVDKIEEQMRDQFGKLPDEVLNLLGVMLIRKTCKDLGIRDISSGVSAIALAFTEKTPVSPQFIVQLVSREPSKFSLTPDNRLRIKVNPTVWPEIYQELTRLN